MLWLAVPGALLFAVGMAIDGSMFWSSIWFAIALGVPVHEWLLHKKRRKIETKWREEEHRCSEEYRLSLEELKRDPRNPDLRQKALQCGRRYMVINPTGFPLQPLTEIGLQSDIDAACSGADVDSVLSPTDEIEKLHKLFVEGVITAEEFERGKATFLGFPPNKAAAAVELLNNLHQLWKAGALSESEFKMKKWDILSERLLPKA